VRPKPLHRIEYAGLPLGPLKYTGLTEAHPLTMNNTAKTVAHVSFPMSPPPRMRVRLNFTNQILSIFHAAWKAPSGRPISVNEVKGRVMAGLDILADHYKI
jgi:hypothetical protein